MAASPNSPRPQLSTGALVPPPQRAALSEMPLAFSVLGRQSTPPSLLPPRPSLPNPVPKKLNPRIGRYHHARRPAAPEHRRPAWPQRLDDSLAGMAALSDADLAAYIDAQSAPSSSSSDDAVGSDDLDERNAMAAGLSQAMVGRPSRAPAPALNRPRPHA